MGIGLRGGFRVNYTVQRSTACTVQYKCRHTVCGQTNNTAYHGMTEARLPITVQEMSGGKFDRCYNDLFSKLVHLGFAGTLNHFPLMPVHSASLLHYASQQIHLC